jgi:hypothetical protein
MDFLDVATAAVISESMKETLRSISPYLANIFGMQDDALSQWMKLQGQKRIDDLIAEKHQLEAENQDLKERITDLEKLSPTSGYTRVLQEYITTPLEEKIRILKNALIQGFYSDIPIELREDFYRIVQNIQPLDVQILKYLVDLSPTEFHYLSAYNVKEEKKKMLLGSDLPDAEKRAENKKIENEYLEFNQKFYYSEIKSNFSQYPDYAIKRSFDRLQANQLIFNIGHNTYGAFNPYTGFAPLTIGITFLNFISDPQVLASSEEQGS